MSSERWVTRAEAAELRGCSTDTIRRSQNAGEYPNHRTDDDGVWHIPLSDLVAAGNQNYRPFSGRWGKIENLFAVIGEQVLDADFFKDHEQDRRTVPD